MALSASTNYSIDRDTLLSDAFAIIGVGVDGETLETADSTKGVRAMNMFIKSLMAEGCTLWVSKNTSITLVASDKDYTIGPTGNKVLDRPFKITQCWARNSDGYDTPVELISKESYNFIYNKSVTTSSAPTQAMYDRTLTNGTLYVWPVPNSTAASEYTLYVEYQKPYDDMDSSTNDFEFPQEWYLALLYGTAAILADFYGLNPTERRLLRDQAKMYKDQALSADVTDESVYFMFDNDRYNSL